MYLQYFGLDRQPFKITPDTTLFYEGGNRGAILEAVSYSVLQGEGIIKVVGEVGSGKTMLCRMLEIKLPPHVEIVYLGNPSLSPEKILHVIAQELKLAVNSQDDKTQVMHLIHQHLLERHAQGKQVVVFIEEAQGMPLETLEEVRLLSNLETGQSKLLQIVLFGQPELDENLGQKQIRQLRERISQHFSLDMFNKQDIQSYLNFRLRAAGYKGADLFTPALSGIIARYSRGLSRRINILADKALLAAYSENTKVLKPRHIKMAAQDSQYKSASFAALLKPATGFVLLAVVFISGVLSSQLISNNTETPLANIKSNEETKKNSASTENKRVFSGEKSQQQLLSGNIEHKESQADESEVALFSRRTKASNIWLAQNSDYKYSIQLMMIEGVPNASVDRYLQKLQANNLLDQTYIVPSIVNQHRVHNVVYGQYKGYSEALQSMRELPALIKQASPFIRSISSIRKDKVS